MQLTERLTRTKEQRVEVVLVVKCYILCMRIGLRSQSNARLQIAVIMYGVMYMQATPIQQQDVCSQVK